MDKTDSIAAAAAMLALKNVRNLTTEATLGRGCSTVVPSTFQAASTVRLDPHRTEDEGSMSIATHQSEVDRRISLIRRLVSVRGPSVSWTVSW
ncbi:hypothetical protein ABIB82_006657 [Bradyrhizobium sp. i1.8.4]|uniref:hypothetical protein n=1 Tax=unclassified Bradyrhizobium TaxID=2631580 RepID=UPI003D1A0BC6